MRLNSSLRPSQFKDTSNGDPLCRMSSGMVTYVAVSFTSYLILCGLKSKLSRNIFYTFMYLIRILYCCLYAHVGRKIARY